MKRAIIMMIPALLAGSPALADEAGSVRVPTTLAASASIAEPGTPEQGFGIGNRYVQFTGRMQNLLLWRNDSDFDRTPPYHNPQGQDVGLLGTFIAPMLVVTPIQELKMVVELELGLNLWSMHDPDTYGATSPGWIRMALRQAYTEGNFLDGKLGFRVGYERLFDPTGMFVGHWLGAANLWTRQDWGSLALTVAQMPDQTYEGVAFDSNNFNTDTFLYGLRLDVPVGKVGVAASVWGMHDRQIVRQPLDLMAVTASVFGAWDRLRFQVDGALQYGVAGTRAGGRDETTLAWAAQGTLDFRHPFRAPGALDLVLHLNSMALSADDAHDGNGRNGAWFYSGRSRSRTLILTEDEIRDRGGNLDELLAERRQGRDGKFTLARSGLSVTDLSLGLVVRDFFLPSITVGAAWALESANALGSSFVGVETDLRLEFRYREYLSFILVGSYLQPGKAAAAFVNRTGNRGVTDPIYQVQTSLTMYY